MIKKFLVIDCLNIDNWYNQVRQDKQKLQGLSVQTLWKIRKNMKKISEIANDFIDFKTNLENEVRDQFFNEDKSEETTTKDEFGNDIPAKKVKQEFLPDYQKRIGEINNKLNLLLSTQEEIELVSINMDEEVERLGTDCNLNMDDLDILSIFEED